MTSRLEVAFGAVAIVLGVGVVAAIAAGLHPWKLLLIAAALAYNGWLVYYMAVARQSLTVEGYRGPLSPSLSIPTSTARSVRSSSQSRNTCRRLSETRSVGLARSDVTSRRARTAGLVHRNP